MSQKIRRKLCALVLCCLSQTNAVADDSFAQNAASNTATSTARQIASFVTQNILAQMLGPLYTIALNTFYTAEYAIKIDGDLTLGLIFLNEWLITPDLSNQNDPTSMMQNWFSTYTNAMLTVASQNNTLQQQLMTSFLQPPEDPSNPLPPPPVPNYVNDMTYQTLLGQLYTDPDPRQNNTPPVDPALNYITNAAGLSISHELPNNAWKGHPKEKAIYQNFYETVVSIQTFSAYVLGEIYEDYKNGGIASSQQINLIQQASNSNWFSIVNSEAIGMVLRHILMYLSQLFVISSQQLQTQKEMLAAQTMTNTLLILNNQINENVLLKNATGQTPVQ